MDIESYDDTKIAFGLNNFSNINSSIAMIRNGIDKNYSKKELFETFLTDEEKNEWDGTPKNVSFAIQEMSNFLELYQFMGIKEFKITWDKELKKEAKQKNPYYTPIFLKRIKHFSEFNENEWKQNAAILLILAYLIDNNIRYIDTQGSDFNQHIQNIISFFKNLKYNPKQTTKPYKPISINIQKIRNGFQCLHDLGLIQNISKGNYFVKLQPELLMFFLNEYQVEKKVVKKNIPISDFIEFLRNRYLIFNTKQRINFVPNYFTAGLFHLFNDNKILFSQVGDVKQPILDSDSLNDKFTARTNVIKLL